MSRIKMCIIGTALVAIVVTPWEIQRRAQNRLNNEVLALRVENQRMASMLTDNARLSNLVAHAGKSNLLSRDQFVELLRLRGEVGQLQQQVKELNKQAEDRQLKPRNSVGNQGDENGGQADKLRVDFPRDSWAFAGYDSPEATLLTLMWARREGDIQFLMASLAPEVVENAQTAWGDKFESELKSRLPGRIDRVSECTIESKEVVSDREVRFIYTVIEQDDVTRKATAVNVTVKRIGDEWKLVPWSAFKSRE